MKKILGKSAPTIAAVAVSAVLSAGGGAYAASQITGAQIKDHTISQADLTKRAVQVMQHQSLRDRQAQVQRGLNQVTKKVTQVQKTANDAKTSAQAAQKAGLTGAIYRVENYTNGGGGSATVACADKDAVSQRYTAIAGGVQGSTVSSQSANGFAVTSSFPGRMDWGTNQPKMKADGTPRLDGWIVLGNAVHTGTLKVWALCVPTTDIPVQTVDLDN